MIEEIFPIRSKCQKFPKQKALWPLPKKVEKSQGNVPLVGFGKLEIYNWLLCLMGHSMFKGMRFSRVRVGFGFSGEFDVAVASSPLHLLQTMYFR